MKRKCPKCYKEIEIDAIRCEHCAVWVYEVDNKKGSGGVIFLGCWIILQGLPFFLGKWIGAIFALLQITLGVGLIICKKWAWVGTIISQGLFILLGLIAVALPFLLKQNIVNSIVGIILLVYSIGIIYFLTRSKIKEQFE